MSTISTRSTLNLSYLHGRFLSPDRRIRSKQLYYLINPFDRLSDEREPRQSWNSCAEALHILTQHSSCSLNKRRPAHSKSAAERAWSRSLLDRRFGSYIRRRSNSIVRSIIKYVVASLTPLIAPDRVDLAFEGWRQ
jgi:hypothetical protein